jgi:PIN domain nuclease of toxin-antitoxin system
LTLLDTHAWLWWLSGSQELPSRTRDHIEAALEAEDLAVAAISAWESSMLVQKRRLTLMVPVDELVVGCERLVGFSWVPLTARIAVKAAGMTLHPDPADRFIAATALTHDATLVTKDERLRSFESLRTLW